MHYIERERTRILLFILFGVIAGSIGVFQRRCEHTIRMINSEQPNNVSIQPSAFIPKTPTPLFLKDNVDDNNKENISANFLGNIREDSCFLKLKRLVTVLNDDKEPTIVDNAFYDIALTYNKTIAGATADINIRIGEISRHAFSIFLSKDTIQNASSFNTYMLDIPFCFYVKNISKPPIILFPQYLNYKDWDELKSSLLINKILNIKYVDTVDIIKAESKDPINNNTCELYGSIHMSLNNNNIQIDSESEGLMEILYRKMNPKNNSVQEMLINGILNRNYSIQVDMDNPYFIKELTYDTISDTTMSIASTHVFHQIILEKIHKVN